jgi:hypothetical protein
MNDSLYRSTDKGTNWRTVAIGFAPEKNSFAAAGSMLFFGSSEGVFRSSDNGQHWTKTSGLGLAFPQTYSLATAGATLFAGSGDGNVSLSTDNGETWVRTNSEPLGAGVASMVKRSNTLFAGTSGRGVWRWPLGGAVSVKNGSQGVPRDVLVDLRTQGRTQTVSLSLPRQERVEVGIFDLSGRKVASLVDRFLAPGFHRYAWKGDRFATGCYTIRIRAGSRTVTQAFSLVH